MGCPHQCSFSRKLLSDLYFLRGQLPVKGEKAESFFMTLWNCHLNLQPLMGCCQFVWRTMDPAQQLHLGCPNSPFARNSNPFSSPLFFSVWQTLREPHYFPLLSLNVYLSSSKICSFVFHPFSTKLKFCLFNKKRCSFVCIPMRFRVIKLSLVTLIIKHFSQEGSSLKLISSSQRFFVSKT